MGRTFSAIFTLAFHCACANSSVPLFHATFLPEISRKTIFSEEKLQEDSELVNKVVYLQERLGGTMPSFLMLRRGWTSAAGVDMFTAKL